MAELTRLERAAFSVTVRRSNQLSYSSLEVRTGIEPVASAFTPSPWGGGGTLPVSYTHHVAASSGFEPKYHVPETCVLPLDDKAKLPRRVGPWARWDSNFTDKQFSGAYSWGLKPLNIKPLCHMPSATCKPEGLATLNNLLLVEHYF